MKEQYIPLGNFLKKHIEESNDPYAINSMVDQFVYLNSLYHGQLSIAELERRTQKLADLKAKFNATVVDNRRAWNRQTTRAVSKLTQLSGVAA